MSDSSLSVSNEVKQTPITRSRRNTENNQKLSAQKLFNQISRAITVATKHQLLTYEGVDPETGFLVACSLDGDGQVEALWLLNEKMRMILSGFITAAEARLLRIFSGTSLWLNGGASFVQTKVTRNRVKAFIKAYDLDPAGNERLLQNETILPRPHNAAAQFITITLGQLFASAISAGRNPNDTFDLSVDDLRTIAIERIQNEGFVPA
ncbi:hypothetical protein V2W45_1472059 [Cenococcum geophilum]